MGRRRLVVASTSGDRSRFVEGAGALLVVVGAALLVSAAALVSVVAALALAGVLLASGGVLLIRLAALGGGS